MDEFAKVKEHARFTDQGIMVINNDMIIVDYILDHGNEEMLSGFQNRPENVGVAVLFHDKGHCKHLTIIIRTKHFEDEKDNGLVMMIVPNIYNHSDRKAELIDIIEKALQDNKKLSDEIVSVIEGHVMKSIQMNA